VIKLAFKGLLARKLRTVLTGFAVVLGVAFVAGTFVFTDTIDAAFKDLFERTSKGGRRLGAVAPRRSRADFAAPPTMPASTLDRVRSVPGVEEADGSVSADVNLLDRAGKPILSNGPPTIAVTTGRSASTRSPTRRAESRRPPTRWRSTRARRQVPLRRRDKVTVAGRAPAKAYTVSGVAKLGDSENLAGSRLVVFTLPEGQRVTGHDGYDDISVAASGGTTPEQLKASIQRELGKEFAVRTGKEQAEKQAQDLSDALGFIRTALLVFAAVALLVGSFLIFNTFSVTVAQRTKEFALLRTIGASRGQVLRSVLVETFVIGVIASLIGIACGLALAPGLAALLSSFGIDLGTTSTVLEPRTIIAGLVVGIVATVVSGIVPARRATRGSSRSRRCATASRPPRARSAGGGSSWPFVVEALGVVLLLYGLLGDPGDAATTAFVLGLGTLLMIFGFALLAPTLCAR
jgi:putative ABC transport system permease protein